MQILGSRERTVKGSRVVGSLGLFLLGGLLPAFAQEMPVPGDPFPGSGFQKQAFPAPYRRLQEIQYLPELNRPLEGRRRILVILMDFPDYPWTMKADSNFVNYAGEPGYPSLYLPEYYQDMLFSLGTFRDPFARSSYTGSLRDFFRENSYGVFDVEGVVIGWFQAKFRYRYYCNTDSTPGTQDDYGLGSGVHSARTLVEEAVAIADSLLDFREFDLDADGAMDGLFVVHAGPGAEALYTRNYPAHFDYLWSHHGYLGYKSQDGVEIRSYTMQPQDGTVGVFCHEYGHMLGIPDLYDPDRSSEGIGEWGLMGSGAWCHAPEDGLGTSPSHFTAWSKYRLGWIEPVWISGDTVQVELRPVEQYPDAVAIWNPVADSGFPPAEYFLLENRQLLGFDRGLTRRQVDFSLPQPHGLIIYHVDERQANNSNEHKKRVDVEEASPVWWNGAWFEHLDHQRDLQSYRYLNKGNRGDDGDPFPGYARWLEDFSAFEGLRTKDEFSSNTWPSSHWNSGNPSGIRVFNIREVDGQVVFDVSVRLPEETAVATGEARAQNGTLRVYPLPARNFLNVQVPSVWSGRGPVELVLVDLLGREVKRWRVWPGSMRLVLQPLQLPGGIYFLRLMVRGRPMESAKVSIFPSYR